MQVIQHISSNLSRSKEKDQQIGTEKDLHSETDSHRERETLCPCVCVGPIVPSKDMQ